LVLKSFTTAEAVGMWATRCVAQAGVELVGNPAFGGLSINPRLRHIHSQVSTRSR